MSRCSAFLFSGVIICCFMFGPGHSCAQQQGHSIGLQPPFEQDTVSTGISHAQTEKMLRWANDERQKLLVKQSSKLVELTAQFKQRMAERGEKRITDDDLKIVAEIEKLARNIREGMAFAGNQPPPPTPQPLLTF